MFEFRTVSLSPEEVQRIQNEFQIPVDDSDPQMFWIISLDRESFMPSDKELQQLRSYCEFIIKRFYDRAAQRRMLEEQKLPYLGGHNTLVFRNGPGTIGVNEKGNPGEWFYRRVSWVQGPRFMPSPLQSDYRPLSLVEAIDMQEMRLVPGPWTKWKAEHSDIFNTD